MADKKKKVSPPKRVMSYLREVKSDLKKITWPAPKQTLNNTIIVLVSLACAGALISAIDFVFAQIVALIISK